LPSGERAPAVAIPVQEALGWLAAVGGGLGRDGVGASVVWLGRVALVGVRKVTLGAVVPTLHTEKQANGRTMDAEVRWVPALIDQNELDRFAHHMPGPVVALKPGTNRAVTIEVLGAVVDAIMREAARKVDVKAPPPRTQTTAAVAEAVVTRLDGSAFEAPVNVATEVSKRLERWAKPVLSGARPTLVVQLDPPDRGDAWFLSVLGAGAEGNLLPIEVALTDSKATKPLADELSRLERILPELLRAGGQRRGQVYLSQPEAWELMTTT